MNPKKLETGYISSLCTELYLILQAGIPMDEGIAILRDGETQTQGEEALSKVYEALLDGHQFCGALEQSQAFPQYMIDMVRVGEETGNLDRSLKALADYYNRQDQLTQNLRRAVLYPAVLMTMLTLVMVILVVEVLPMFSDVYAQLGGTMTGLGAGILAFGTMLKAHWLAAILVVIALASAAVFFVVHSQKQGDRVLLSKKLGLSVATAKLVSAMAMALHSGLDMDMTMELAENLTQHPALQEKLHRCRQKMAEGASFAQVIVQETLFSGLHCRMLAVGMRTGTMDQVMEDMAIRCDNQAQDEIDRYVGNVEPTLVVIMSVLVGVVLLSVMLPLANIMSALG